MKTISHFYSKPISSLGFLILIIGLLLIGQTPYVQQQYKSVNHTRNIPLWIWSLGMDVSKPHTNCSISNKDVILLNHKPFTIN